MEVYFLWNMISCVTYPNAVSSLIFMATLSEIIKNNGISFFCCK